MAFFDKIGGTISSKSKDVATKAKDMVDVAGLNSSVTAEENKIVEAYKKIGSLYYKANKDNPESEFIDLITVINDANELIAGYKREINKIKGFCNCTKCGAEISTTAIHCEACGAKNEIAEQLKAEALRAEEEEKAAEEAQKAEEVKNPEEPVQDAQPEAEEVVNQ